MKRQLGCIATVALIAGSGGCADTPTEPGPMVSVAKGGPVGHKRVVFASARDGNREIYSMTPEGNFQTNLTGTSGIDESEPSLSRDNATIVFVAGQDLYSMSVQGGPRTRLTNTAAAERLPAWSPGGKAIAYTRAEVGALMSPNIWVMDADGSNPRQVTNFSGAEHPTWSPDGSQIAFTAGGVVRVVSASCVLCTGGTQIGNSGTNPAWAPDGSHLVYARYLPGEWFPDRQLYAYNFANGSEIQIVVSSHMDVEPAWSSDGTKLYFTRVPFGSGGNHDVFVLDYSHNMFYNERQLTTALNADNAPSGGG